MLNIVQMFIDTREDSCLACVFEFLAEKMLYTAKLNYGYFEFDILTSGWAWLHHDSVYFIELAGFEADYALVVSGIYIQLIRRVHQVSTTDSFDQLVHENITQRALVQSPPSCYYHWKKPHGI